ncbi:MULTISPECIES: putative manganese-dependent inorganic diphosphatase [Clostridium]|jgi:manganese-dependent inorganic pyrophosphatase|uniref:putative manganese-dependent inorganic diphosphatase n=2 Tax=Clostridiaceae TaxID=31979 RepID=UPI0004AE10D3|nr:MULTISPECIES: putative manganese-dependent inorganic diphosphatase [Clostridium]MBX9185049.1 putative manganese-dependent inorganic diphosphatase [Clostridium sp. K04]MDU3520392.1 putative manganese-dependent inorganic diphosphatase [Clostridium saudiense]MDU7453722.1 putative manganese-dependent inorganic diphosphatase [Clostridium saudiense]CUO10052.1 manganese-dependent inorganic pyrophosphatase [Clostridium disporicum]SCI80535.1 Manganese-dependent inorganic pyrophosphatase [uncultured 
MKDIIYVTGHKNPDSDSICAAYAYAEFKNKIGDVETVACRLGNPNQETQYILDYFNAEAPRLLKTVKLKVEDLQFDNISPVSPEISLKTAWSIMRDKNIKTLPVADENDHLLGVLAVSNLTSCYMDIWDNRILAKSNTTLDNIIDTLSAKVSYVNEKVTHFPGKIVVTAMQPDTMSGHIDEGDIAIVGDREEAQAALIKLNISLMIVTGGYAPSEKIVSLAKEHGVTIIVTQHDSFTASRLIVQSIPVGYVMVKENIVSFTTDDLVDDIKGIMTETRFRSYPVLDQNGRVVGTVSRYHLISNHKKKVIQVDHNERGQSVDGLEDAEVLEIIDHHRVADIQTNNPIYFRNEPVGSTSTIVAKCFFESGIRPSRKAAGLLCGAIISDTLLFRSPTCTPQDQYICKKLAEIADINIEEFAKEMFKAGTSLKGKTVEQIFNSDFKPFTIEDTKVGIAQVNTMDIEGFMPLKEEMLNYMDQKAKEAGLDMVMLLLTDILNEGSEILVTGNKPEIVEKAFNVTLKDKGAFLPGVLSRKKQVVPPITNAITS